MLIIICITILASLIMGKSIESQLEKLKNIDWRKETSQLFDKINKYAIKAGRVASHPILQFYYVLTDADTTVTEKAMIYAAIIYTVLPISLIPQSVFKFLGIFDEGAAVIFVYKKIKSKITPEINSKVDNTINDWFGVEYKDIKTDANK